MHPLPAEIIAGYLGGTAKTLAVYPLDTMTTLRELRLPLSTDWLRYYRGCGVTLLGLMPYAMIFHTAFFYSESALGSLPPGARQMFAGLMGSLAAAVVGVPFECIKHRVQLCAPLYSTPAMAVATTLRTEGLRGIFTGFGSTLARNAPYNALHFGLFASASRLTGSLSLPAGAGDAIAGALAGALTALLTTPMDLVNTRLQTQALGKAAAASAMRYGGIGDALVRIVRDEGGPAALFQGAWFRVGQYAPASLIFFLCYEAAKRILGGTGAR